MQQAKSAIAILKEDTDIFEGKSATAMRRYIQEVHGETLYAFSLAFLQMEEAIKIYTNTFQVEVDEHYNAVLETEYMEQTNAQVNRMSWIIILYILK